jgi:long-chain acyl-CoA synthetase
MSGRNVYGFWKIAEMEPSTIVVIDPEQKEWSAQAMLSVSNRLVHRLRGRGMRVGDALAVALPDSAPFLQLYLAALQAGFYFIPLNPASTASELVYILRDSQAVLLVHDQANREAVTRVTLNLQSTTAVSLEDLLAESDGESPETPMDRTSGAPLFYTSGTTGQPKAVLKPLGQTCPDRLGKFAAVHLNAVCGIRPRSGAVHLVVSPLYHSASLLWCTDHLHLGHTVVLAGAWDSARILTLIQRYGVTGSLMVPTHFYRLLQMPECVRKGFALHSLRHVVHTGAPCPTTVKQAMLDWWGPVIYEVYGAAEGGGTRVTPKEWLARPGTVGRSFGRIRILDDGGEECPIGETGIVFIKLGPTAFSYRNAPGKTRLSQKDGYFTVGDRGYLDQDDYLFLRGRETSMILSGGVNVYPAEVEAAIISHPQVADVVVVGVSDDEFGQRVKAVVQPVSGVSDRTLQQDLALFVEQELAPAKRPRLYQFVDHLPRNPAGKIAHGTLLNYQKKEAPGFPVESTDTGV